MSLPRALHILAFIACLPVLIVIDLFATFAEAFTQADDGCVED